MPEANVIWERQLKLLMPSMLLGVTPFGSCQHLALISDEKEKQVWWSGPGFSFSPLHSGLANTSNGGFSYP
jgi:hypothetical protein